MLAQASAYRAADCDHVAANDLHTSAFAKRYADTKMFVNLLSADDHRNGALQNVLMQIALQLEKNDLDVHEILVAVNQCAGKSCEWETTVIDGFASVVISCDRLTRRDQVVEEFVAFVTQSQCSRLVVQAVGEMMSGSRPEGDVARASRQRRSVGSHAEIVRARRESHP
jgi:hypothetical protein